jgi:hypothetical protein
MRRLGGMALAAMMAVCAMGCVATRKPVVECKFPRQVAPPSGSALVAEEYGVISPIPLDAVQYTDQSLSKQIAVQSLQAHRTQTNTVQVTARLINCTDSPKVVGVRSNFMDRSEFALEPASVWQNLVLQPRSMGIYQESSLSAAVQHYVVELHNADN